QGVPARAASSAVGGSHGLMHGTQTGGGRPAGGTDAAAPVNDRYPRHWASPPHSPQLPRVPVHPALPPRPPALEPALDMGRDTALGAARGPGRVGPRRATGPPPAGTPLSGTRWTTASAPRSGGSPARAGIRRGRRCASRATTPTTWSSSSPAGRR